MPLTLWPPLSVSSAPSVVTVVNPDGTDAIFNFKTVEPPQVIATSGLATNPLWTEIIAALSAPLRKIIVKNDSGNELRIRCGTRPPAVIGKGADYEEVDLYGAAGEAVEINSNAAPSAGTVTISFLG